MADFEADVDAYSSEEDSEGNLIYHPVTPIPDKSAKLVSLEEARKDPGLEIYTVVIGAHPGAADSFSDKVIMLSGAAEKDKLIQIVAPVL